MWESLRRLSLMSSYKLENFCGKEVPLLTGTIRVNWLQLPVEGVSSKL